MLLLLTLHFISIQSHIILCERLHSITKSKYEEYEAKTACHLKQKQLHIDHITLIFKKLPKIINLEVNFALVSIQA